MLAALSECFLAVLFLQSGLDKVLDRRGHLAAYVEATSRGPLKRWAKSWLNLVTLLEVLAGAVSAAGVVLYVLDGRNPMLAGGAVLSVVALLVTFAMQRLNRDEGAAARLVPYFLVALAAVQLNGR